MEPNGRLDPLKGNGEDWPRPETPMPGASFEAPTPTPLPGLVDNPPAVLPGSFRRDLAGTRLSILLPALNEERGVVNVMRRIPHRTLTQSGFLPNVYLLDGRSTDRTRLFAAQLGAKVIVQRGVGKGAAFREFIPGIQEELCVFLDCDGTYPPEIIPRFVEKLREGHPVVLGSRMLGDIDDGAMSPLNYIGNRLLSRFASFLFGIPISDVCSGMWAFSSPHLKSLTLTAQGFELEAELFAECALKQIPIVEVPIPYAKRLGQPKLRARMALQIAFALFKKRLQSRAPKPAVSSRMDWIPPVGGQGGGS